MPTGYFSEIILARQAPMRDVQILPLFLFFFQSIKAGVLFLENLPCPASNMCKAIVEIFVSTLPVQDACAHIRIDCSCLSR